LTRTLTLVCAGASLASLAVASLLGGTLFPAVLLPFLGLVWVIGLIRRWTWAAPAGLCAVFGCAAWGGFQQHPLVPGLVAALLALAVYDLAAFEGRLRLASEQDDLRDLERGHLGRLLLTLAAGALLLLPAFALRVEFKFELAIAAILAAVWGLGRVAGWLLNRD
jgi:hypothetical protein